MSKVYEIVQQRIIDSLEKAIKEGGTAPWCKPWVSRKAAPKNFITKKQYRGVNLLLLEKGGYYLSFKQIQTLQKKYDFLKLKKGSKSNMVVFWTFVEKEEEDTKDDEKKTKSVPIFRYYNVFHESDIEGFEKILSPAELEERKKSNKYEISSYEETDRLIEQYKDIVPINFKDNDKAYYSPKSDYISVPPKELFKTEEEFYSTIFHEMIHSTGHKSRLDRLASNFSFGDHNYSKEELVAEIGSSMLCAEFNIETKGTIQNSTAYLYGWLSAIKQDITLITNAAQAAQKACDYILEKVGYFECEEIKGSVVNE